MRKYIKTSIIALAAQALMPSCKEVDIDLFESPVSEQGVGTLSNTDATVSTLDFAWQPVEGVYQYGYTLIADDRTVRQGVTRDTAIHFEKLEQDTEYTLNVEAFGANQHPTLSYTLKARTSPIRQLATPDVKGITATFADGAVTITWPEVEHAEYYDYVLLNANGDELLDGTVDVNCIEFKSIPIGKYVIEITADSEDEGYTRSETASFAFEREHQVTAEYSGTYTSQVLGSYPCTLKVYDDGVYSVESFYGVAGYNLDFSLSNKGEISILNYYYSEGKFRYVATGLADIESVIIYEDTAYCTYSARPTGKTIKLYLYVGNATTAGYDTFTWK